MKYTTVKISEIMNHPTKRMNAKYWIRLHSHNILDSIRKKNVQSNTKRKIQRKKDRSKHSS